MTGQLLAFVLLLMAAVAPGGAHTGNANVVASAIAYVVDRDPLPSGWDKHQSAAVLVEMAYRESRFRVGATGPARCDKRGDCLAYGPFQAEHRPEMARDPIAAARLAYWMLRAGVLTCPEAPLAPAAGGCLIAGTLRPNAAARRISDARMLEANRILDVAEGNVEED
jgi:hypothetical protein